MSLTLASCSSSSKKTPAASSAAPTTSSAASSAAPTSAAATTSAPAASSAAATTAPAAGGLKIAILPKGLNIPYFDAWYKGAKKACDELKAASCDYVGPTQATGDAQLEFIGTLVQKGYDAIVVSAADKDKVAPALLDAQKKGITIITDDADVSDPTARSLMIQPSSADLIGIQQVKWALQLAPNGGEVAILSAAATAENQNKWIGFMKTELQKPEYAKLKLVDTVYGDDDAAKSAEKAAGLMQAHPNLKVIISPTTVGIREAAKYISGSKYKGKVFVTGLGLPSEMKAYSKDGTSPVFGLWNPVDLGYIGVYAAAGVHDKTIDPKEGSTFKAGTFNLTVGKDGVVTIGPPFEFTPANIDEFAAIY